MQLKALILGRFGHLYQRLVFLYGSNLQQKNTYPNKGIVFYKLMPAFCHLIRDLIPDYTLGCLYQ